MYPHRIAAFLLASGLALCAIGGTAFADGAHLANQRLDGASRLDPPAGLALEQVSLARSSSARQGMFRNPLKWSPDSASAEWTAVSTSNPEAPNGSINGVACTSSTNCEAIGSSQNGGDQPVLLAQVWNGASWTTQSVPRPAGSVSAELIDIAYVNADDCVAVGDYGTSNGNLSPLSEVWDGAKWTRVFAPAPSGNTGATLTGVSCLGTVCEAVGYYYDDEDNQLALAEALIGGSWRIQKTPDPTKTNGAQLNSVSCSAGGCEAVGYYGTGSEGFDDSSFAEVWNGAVWSSQKVPEPSDSSAQDTELQSVSCVSGLACEAVGSYANKTGFAVALAEVWNGLAWKVQTAANPADSTGLSLQVVSCVATDACAAVGSDDYGRGEDAAGVAEIWNGADWAAQSTADPGRSADVSLGAVSCVASGFCEAGGAYVNSSGDQKVLAEDASGGRWLAQPAPNGQSGNYGSQLAGVSCAKISACEAVGSYQANNATDESKAWAEQFSGGRWKLQFVPGPRGYSNSQLKAVSCTSASRCEAVGVYVDSAENDLTIAELWNGRSWTLQRSANASGDPDSLLAGVSCTSRNNCEAVGARGGASTLVLAEHWNGHKWDVQGTPKTKGIGGGLRAVSCASAKHCEAVGEYLHSASSEVPLAEAWNGHKWALQPVPEPKGAHNTLLNGISCISSNNCEAVGTYVHGEGERPLAELWNGHKWAVQSTINPGSPGDISLLAAVSCTAKNACEAVGYHVSFITFDQYTLVEVWNGHSWRRQSAATPGGYTASPAAVSCASKRLCRLVGDYQAPSAALEQSFASEPLIETYRG